jgi:hypothetical protein
MKLVDLFENKIIDLWHLGQEAAVNNDYKKAIILMKQSYNNEDLQWNDYVSATIAFLLNDKQSFEKYLGKKPNYNEKTIERLCKNWGKPYKTAY